MGFFSRKSPIEKQLEETHASMFAAMGMPAGEARRTAKELVAEAKARCEEGELDMPPSWGDLLLRREKVDPDTRASLAIKRAEGVTDDDIRWWWNLHPLERRVMDLIDENFRGRHYLNLCAEGLSKEEAIARVLHGFAMFGDPSALSDADHSAGDDRPLPYELKDRVSCWAAEQGARDPDGFRRRIENASSMNALIRAEIRAGRMGGPPV